MPDSRPPIVGVRLGNAGRIEYFDCGRMRLEAGEYVVVQSTRGPELARVVVAPDQVLVNEMERDDLHPILRLATAADLAKADDLKQRARELLDEARSLAGEAGFPAHLDGAAFTLDGRRLRITFTHGSRVEYRNTARKLSESLAVRVDMSQLGARDRARMAGGYGICGRELCCANWLDTFPAISIRMAKDQELPLNPQKISGLCGRLLCCLSYEDEGYKTMRKTLPKVGQRVSTPTGEGKVVALNILQRKVTLMVDGQRVEVGDRDLGLVVRWDPSSRSAVPPPSLTPAEAAQQGLISQEEADQREEEEGAAREASWMATFSGRTSEPPHPSGAAGSGSAAGKQRRSRGRRRSKGRRAAEPAPAIKGAKTRSFRRGKADQGPTGREEPLPPAAAVSAGAESEQPTGQPAQARRAERDGESAKTGGGRRRRRRRGRGARGGGTGGDGAAGGRR